MLTLLILLSCIVAVVGCQALIRGMMFYPTHHPPETSLTPWMLGDAQIGYAREVAEPAHVWLFLHGNGGQASHRGYAMPSFDARDAVFVLEYPGYGQRKGTPSRRAFDAAAREGYAALRARFPGRRICVAGESLGSGPASVLSAEQPPPDKIVLVVPFDSIKAVGRRVAGRVPAALALHGAWDNIKALRGFDGEVEIFGAERDEVLPIAHAEALARALPNATLHRIPGGHGWATGGAVSFRCS